MKKNPTTEAELAIGSILAELERTTGQHVETIEIQNTDVTRLESERQELNRRVVIELKPITGSHWETHDWP